LSRARIPLTIRVLGALAVAGAFVACGDSPTPVAIRATLNGVPVAGLDVTAYPFDIGGVLDSLAAAHGEPPPDFAALEQELLAFTPPDPAPDDTLAIVWRATRDSVAALADSLNGVDRRSPGYQEAYRRFRQLYGRLVQRSTAREAARRGDIEPLRDLALRAGRAADSLRAWERAAYAGFDTAVSRLAAAQQREPVTATSAADGWLELELPRGRWWLEARLPQRDNPFAEYVWRVGLVSAGLPFRVPLSEATASVEWRH
jgi:hypothetical protein